MAQGIVSGSFQKFVKSVQHGSITMTSNQTATTATINVVNTANAVVIWNGLYYAGVDDAREIVMYFLLQ